MNLWQWARVWVWLFGLGAIETAPSPESAKTPTLGPESPLFIDRPDFFDYPDSDQARLLALAQFIGEKPVIFVNSGMKQPEKGSPPHWCLEESPFSPLPCPADSNSRFFHHILVGSLVVAFFFLLFQFCTHM
ncbi:uncharacterized protein C16orf92 homolog [Phyllostomus discolor]|uniref:Uncharacterized protein C16orf92 homolog n=1 Tax=Phyllostomus discolor TaxID=89673 RepID=A0A7E6DCN7_9CHIR|nr:uncharacterized protein C16orf92 homolog [Phyllostomus discolor]